MPGEGGIAVSIAIHHIAFLNIHTVLILLYIQNLLQFYFRFDEELYQYSLRKGIHIGHLLIHWQLKPCASSAHDQHLIVFLTNEAIVDLSGSDLMIM